MSEYYNYKYARDLEPYFSRHMLAMTAEDLDSKADIAAELAFRDKHIAEQGATITKLKHYNSQCVIIAEQDGSTITELKKRIALLEKVAELLCVNEVQMIISLFAKSGIDWENIRVALRVAGYLGEGK